MTTIAYRDGVLAADSRATNAGGMHLGRVLKIAKRGVVLAAAAGQAAHARAGLDWFRSGMNGPLRLGDSDANADLTLFLPDGLIVELCPRGGVTCRAPYYANGSGSEVAWGALYIGASAVEAVQAAMAHDGMSGGEIAVLCHSR